MGTAQIADHLGISPGNLYYHFRNREEILCELFDEMTRDLEEVLRVAPDESITVARLASCYVGGTKVLWRYRFFFASAIDFISRDESLSKKYQEFSARSKRYIRLHLQGAVKNAPGRCPLSAKECEYLAETMWVLWVSWPSLLRTQHTATAHRGSRYRQGPGADPVSAVTVSRRRLFQEDDAATASFRDHARTQ